MTFYKAAPQVFVNTDGYTVQVGSRTTMEYLQDGRKAVAAVDFGIASTCVYKGHVEGWFFDGRKVSMTEAEKDQVVQRIIAALQYDGSGVEVLD